MCTTALQRLELLQLGCIPKQMIYSFGWDHFDKLNPELVLMKKKKTIDDESREMNCLKKKSRLMMLFKLSTIKKCPKLLFLKDLLQQEHNTLMTK